MSRATSVDLELVVDDAPREVEVPADFAAALAANPTERAKFAKLSATATSAAT